MSVVTAAPAPGLRHAPWARPDRWLALAAAAAWTVLAVGPEGPHGLAAQEAAFVLMVVAMMVPLRLPVVRYVAASSLRSRRARSVAAFLAGYVAVWAMAGAGIVLALGALRAWLGPLSAVGVAFSAAIAWTLAPARRRRLRGCQQTASLRLRGRSADADCARYGMRIGWSCVAACWALMAAAASSHSLGVMAVVWGVQLAERSSRVSMARTAAVVMAGLALATIGLTVRAPESSVASGGARTAWTGRSSSGL
jgi:predicted metal-binding membrane protein